MSKLNKHSKIDTDLNRIDFLDQRFYQRKKEYYPSVTYILNSFPKEKFFEEWLKQVGYNSNYIVHKAATEGTQTHYLIEQYLEGKEINWLDDYGKPKYSEDVWSMFLKFTDFWSRYKPELVKSEILLYSDTHKYAGTCDLIVRIYGVLWLLDIKTSNVLHKAYDLQLSAYSKAWDELTGEKIQKVGIIWLKSTKRSHSDKKMQGIGWEVVQPELSIDTNFEFFLKMYDIFKLLNPKPEPIFKNYPLSAKLDF